MAQYLIGNLRFLFGASRLSVTGGRGRVKFGVVQPTCPRPPLTASLRILKAEQNRPNLHVVASD
jgi:hypothetical protein